MGAAEEARKTVRDLAKRQQDMELRERQAKLGVDILKVWSTGGYQFGHVINSELVRLSLTRIQEFMSLE